MNIEKAKEIANNIQGFKTNRDDFIERNINSKISKYSEEHIILLKAFYDLSKDTIESSKNSNYNQFKIITYHDIKEIVRIEEPVLGICWMDLENDGFILEVKCYEYAIRPLGIMFIEKLLKADIVEK